MLPEDRKERLLSYKAKKVDFLDFASIRDISAEEFLSFVKNKYNPDLISCGFNFRFGKSAKGDSNTIKEFCEKNSIEFRIAPPIYEEEKLISSTSLRNMIRLGEVETANGMIYGGFGFTSKVLHGDERGRQIGFPTINQKIPQEIVLPKFGVYASKVTIKGTEYSSITNLGVRPTFLTEDAFCETHIFDFCGEIYDENVTLSLKKYIREEKKFGSITELKVAINNDISLIKNIGG